MRYVLRSNCVCQYNYMSKVTMNLFLKSKSNRNTENLSRSKYIFFDPVALLMLNNKINFQAIYPFMTWCKLIRKPLHKMIWGGILAAAAFVISGIVEISLLVNFEGLVTLRLTITIFLTSHDSKDISHFSPLMEHQLHRVWRN